MQDQKPAVKEENLGNIILNLMTSVAGRLLSWIYIQHEVSLMVRSVEPVGLLLRVGLVVQAVDLKPARLGAHPLVDAVNVVTHALNLVEAGYVVRRAGEQFVMLIAQKGEIE